MTKQWVDPYPFEIVDTERAVVVARAATEALAKAYAADSLDASAKDKYKIRKAAK